MNGYYYVDNDRDRIRIRSTIIGGNIEIIINNKNPVVMPMKEWKNMYKTVKKGKLYRYLSYNGNRIHGDRSRDKIYINIVNYDSVTTVEMSVEEFEKMYEAMK